MKSRIAGAAASMVSVFCFLFIATDGFAGWEAGGRIGYDSNVNRSVSSRNAQSDAYLSGYLSFMKGPSGESRLNFAFDGTLQASGYQHMSDLSFGQITLSPALVYFPHRAWIISVVPFIQAKAVVDSDQSALALGGKFSLRQQVSSSFYLSEYYLYRDSSAKVDTYSFSENTVGLLAGINWTNRLFTELSYEYSREDSFLSVGSSSGVVSGGRGRGRGRNARVSSAFESTVVREKVDRNSGSFTLGVDLTKSLFSTATYTYTSFKGDSGKATSQGVFLTVGYRF